MSSDIEVIGTIEGSISDGGWKMSGAILNDADRISFHQRVTVNFDLYVGGWEALPRPAFNGHVIPEKWRKRVMGSEAPFDAFTAQEFMKNGRIQGIFFRDVVSPANEHQITDMTYADIVSHIVGQPGEYGHCNLVAGVWPEGIITTSIETADSSPVDEYEVKEGIFWTRLLEIAEIDFHILYFTKFNTLNYIIHPMFGALLPDPVLTLTSGLLAEPLEIENRNEEGVGQVIIQGTTPAGSQISGRYPTDPQPGPQVVRSGYLGADNSLMADIAERKYRFDNRSHTVTAKINNGVGLLFGLLDRVAITYQSLVDGVNWTSKKFWVHEIKVDVMSNFTAATILKLEAEN